MSARRTWDKDYYERRARERAELGDDYVDKEENDHATKKRKVSKEEFQEADEGAAGPIGSQRAFLKARENKIDLETKVGKVEVINPTDAGDYRGAGFWCDVCKCLLKDSASYLDHVNGRKHQHALGYSMRVERADVTSVKKRLEALKKKVVAKAAADAAPRISAFQEYETRLDGELREQEEMKKKRREAADAKKREMQRLKELESTNEEGIEEADGADEMAAMLGFKGFGSSKK